MKRGVQSAQALNASATECAWFTDDTHDRFTLRPDMRRGSSTQSQSGERITALQIQLLPHGAHLECAVSLNLHRKIFCLRVMGDDCRGGLFGHHLERLGQ